LGDCAHARDVVLARASMTYGVRALCLFKFCTLVYVRMYVPMCASVLNFWSGLFPFSELVYDLLSRRLFDGFC